MLAPKFVATFPTIEEGSRSRCEAKGVEFLIDLSARRFTRRSEMATITVKEIGREEIKLKNIPIKLRWPSHGRVEELPPMAGGGQFKLNDVRGKGPTRHRPWFRLPPKVQIIPGILGPAPSEETRVAHLRGGEREVRDDKESGH
jgi:hypothetical protein